MSVRSIWISCIATLSLASALNGQESYTLAVLADEPVALYSFVSGPGAGSIIDITGNGHDSKSMTGNVEIVSGGIVGDAALFSLDPDTNMGGSIAVDLQFNPADPEGDGVGMGLGDFTIEALVSPLEVGRGAQVFLSQKDGTGLGRSNSLINANELYGSFMGGGTTDSARSPEEDVWVHYAMTFDGDGGSDAVKFYIDGELSGEPTSFRPQVNGLPESADGDWVIGSHKNEVGQFFIGLLDEIAFYDYRLDDPNGDDDSGDSLIPSHYEALFPGVTLACDFDGDGECTILDLDELQYVGLGTEDSKYDLNGSGGVIDAADTLAWLSEIETVPGDANLDLVVDANDLNAVGISWQSAEVSSWANGDFDGNGKTDAGDLNLVGINWQFGVAEAAAVPEPATCWPILVGGLLVWLRRR